MTAAPLLATSALQTDLRRMVRRRVPARDVDDVVQEVLCDALASPFPGTTPREVVRWVMAIARHKVADYHRRAGRELPTDDLEIASSSSVVEDRDLLDAVLREASAEARGTETLDWIVREHEGEPLSAIAAVERLGAAAVRQRVSRFRRRMRLALLMAAALGVAAVFVAWGIGEEAVPGVVADGEAVGPTLPLDTRAQPAASASATSLAFEGTWRIEDAQLASGASPALRSIVAAQSVVTRIDVSGDDVTITSPTRVLHGTLESAASQDPGRFTATLHTDRGSATLEIAVDAAGATVTAANGPLPGMLRLRR